MDTFSVFLVLSDEDLNQEVLGSIWALFTSHIDLVEMKNFEVNPRMQKMHAEVRTG